MVGLAVHFEPPSYIFYQCVNLDWHSVIATLVYYSRLYASVAIFCYYLCSLCDARICQK